jgi:hypothetical protein
MPAVVVFGLSAIACRDFFLYYWRAMAREPVQAALGGRNDVG